MILWKSHQWRARVLYSLLLALGSCGPPCQGHDFWVQPQEYWVRPAVVLPVTLQVGHGQYRQRSPIPLRRIQRFEAIGPDGRRVDMREHLHPGGASEDGSLQLEQPGTYVLVLETDNRAQSHLPAIRFNDYLASEGLTPALTERQRTRRTQTDGSECYSRSAKVIMQVGTPGTRGRDPVTEPVGLPLEIVPEESPYAVPRPTALPIRVLYQGRPLAGALVKLTQLENDAAPFATHLTDAAGRAVFVIHGEGSWLLNVVWTRPLPPSSETDFETMFSSLSFGLPRQP